VSEEWRQLAAQRAEPAAFTTELTAGLPEPARRWLTHAIPAGTPQWQVAELRMRGQIRLGGWRPFTARQALAPPAGYIWAATARLWGTPVSGFDRLSSGTGQMRWRLAGLLPVMSAGGRDIACSAAGRLAAEIVLGAIRVQGSKVAPGTGADSAVATMQVGKFTESTELRVESDGRLLGVLVNRWGDPDRKGFQRVPFGVTVETETRFAGVAIPGQFRAGWWWGTDRQPEGEFFRAEITSAEFR
jgi:hypothetical protein